MLTVGDFFQNGQPRDLDPRRLSCVIVEEWHYEPGVLDWLRKAHGVTRTGSNKLGLCLKRNEVFRRLDFPLNTVYVAQERPC